jgi:hypothetical protein
VWVLRSQKVRRGRERGLDIRDRIHVDVFLSEEYQQQKRMIVDALTGTDYDGVERVTAPIEFYNEYRSAGQQRVLGPFDTLPKDGLSLSLSLSFSLPLSLSLSFLEF